MFDQVSHLEELFDDSWPHYSVELKSFERLLSICEWQCVKRVSLIEGL